MNDDLNLVDQALIKDVEALKKKMLKLQTERDRLNIRSTQLYNI